MPLIRFTSRSALCLRPASARGLAWLGLGSVLAWFAPGATAQSNPPMSSGGSFSERGLSPDVPSIRLADALPLFFPPSPPPLGRAFARNPVTQGRNLAPPELAGFVNEAFYPALGTRLATKTLNDKLRAQLERYRAAKAALQNELRAELQRVQAMEPDAREAAFTAFSRQQTPKIAALEKTAEELRRDLINSDNHWSALRQWRLGDKERRGFSPIEIGQVMRGYAFYDQSLLPAQRRLLREIFLELANAGDNTATATAQQPYLFFPPEPARVLLPDDLPPQVAAKLAAYQTKKSHLKKELYEAVHVQDGKTLRFLRGNSLKALAEKQASALAELDALAEEIRRELARVAEPTTIAERTPLTPTLHNRVAVLMGSFSVLQRETAVRLEDVLASIKGLPIQASYRFENDGLKYVIVPTRARGGVSPETLARVTEVRARVQEVADDYGRRVVDLINEKDAIRAEIARGLGSNASAVAIDSALAAASRVVTAKETENSYREYRIAVFQPGLSPEQRRLLFDSVVERLELPLPRGEAQPIYRASTW